MNHDETYDLWNEKKKQVSRIQHPHDFHFRQGDIWWCSLGKNIGTESFGKGEEFRRPILVLKKLSHEACIAIPLSTQSKTGTWFLEFDFQGEKRCALLYQIRMVHSKRFQRLIGQIGEPEMILVKEKLKQLLEFS